MCPGRRSALACVQPFPAERMRSKCYFHFVTANRPGIWALVTGICAENGINIESVHQKWEDKTKPSDLFMLVDEAEEAQVRAAFAKIVSSDGIYPESRYFRVLAMPAGRGAMIDLHTHTFLSDGELGPAELVRRAEHAGYRAIGITDHADASNLDNLLSALVQFARETQPFVKIRIIPGVELTHVPPGPDQRAWSAARGSSGRAWWSCTGKRSANRWRSAPTGPGSRRAWTSLPTPGLYPRKKCAWPRPTACTWRCPRGFSHGMGNGRVVALRARPAPRWSSIQTRMPRPTY